MPLAGVAPSPSSPLHVGVRSGYSWKGASDEVQVFRRALTAAEVVLLAAVTIHRPPRERAKAMVVAYSRTPIGHFPLPPMHFGDAFASGLWAHSAGLREVIASACTPPFISSASAP